MINIEYQHVVLALSIIVCIYLIVESIKINIRCRDIDKQIKAVNEERDRIISELLGDDKEDG